MVHQRPTYWVARVRAHAHDALHRAACMAQRHPVVQPASQNAISHLEQHEHFQTVSVPAPKQLHQIVIIPIKKSPNRGIFFVSN